MPGHFEVYPRRYTDGGSEGHPDDLRVAEPTGDYGWRFVDEDGKHRSHSEGGFDSIDEAKADAAAVVLSQRTATYGQRFAAELADAVRVVDL